MKVNLSREGMEEFKCHLDTHLRKEVINRQENWKPIFG
jgi:hypothetical protein